MLAVALSAIFAEPVNLERVPGGFVMVLAPDLLFQPIHFGGKELNRTAASCAYHVMVTASIVLMLITSNPVMKRNFARQSTFGEQLQRAVNGSKSDARIALAD